jgi:hypothetical protein
MKRISFPLLLLILQQSLLTLGFDETSLLECGNDLDVGLEFYGFNNENQRFQPYGSNPFFDPTKPTLLHIHGWTKDACKNRRKNTFIQSLERFLALKPIMSKRNLSAGIQVNYSSTQPVDIKSKSPMADLWLKNGWNMAIFNWNMLTDKNSPMSVERTIFEPSHKHHGFRFRSGTQGKFKYSGAGWSELTASDLFVQRALIPLIKYGYEPYWSGKSHQENTRKFPEIRISAHSVAASLAIKGTYEYYKFHEGQNDTTVWIKRIALLDPWFGRNSKSTDVLLNMARYLDQKPRDIFFEWYKTSTLCNIGDYIRYGHCSHPVQKLAALVRLNPKIKIDSLNSLMRRIGLLLEIQHKIVVKEYLSGIRNSSATEAKRLHCICNMDSFQKIKVKKAMKTLILETHDWGDVNAKPPGFCNCTVPVVDRLSARLPTDLAKFHWKGHKFYHINDRITLEIK